MIDIKTSHDIGQDVKAQNSISLYSSMKNILVPVDFSPASDNALLFASFLAKRLAWNIHILNVFHLPNPMVTLPIELVITLDELKSDSDSALKKLAADASAKSGLSIEQYHIESRNGGTVHEIVD
ncbi:MAG: universal stress protein, partial [Flavobacteriales bacterium]